MKHQSFTRVLAMVLCAVMAMTLLPLTARADMGPKPSVRIRFENLGDELCYGTLLSATASTGPASAWNGKEEDARHNGIPAYSHRSYGYDVWKAFVDYSQQDDFYFLQEAWQVNETKTLSWTYYPPQEFKILLYFPESSTFADSEVCQRYAFDSYFTVDMEGVTLLAAHDGELPAREQMQPHRSYQYAPELLSLLARILVTILIEMGVALLFGFRGKRALLLLAEVNAGTQILLNVLLNVINYFSGSMAFVVFYILLEVVVFAAEGIVYSTALKKVSGTSRGNWFYWLYALAANAVSFGAGFFVAKLLPGIF